MMHYNNEWIEQWCEANGWTDWFIECHQYWAFPPGGVMPEPIPSDVLRFIKIEKGASNLERLWLTTGIIVTIAGIILSYFCQSPTPFVLAFAWNAIIAILLEVEDN